MIFTLSSTMSIGCIYFSYILRS